MSWFDFMEAWSYMVNIHIEGSMYVCYNYLAVSPTPSCQSHVCRKQTIPYSCHNLVLSDEVGSALMQCETGLAAARKASPEVCVPAKGVKSRTFGSRTNPSQLGSSKSREHLDRPSHLTV
jgi:hypothetical protein